jgi:hypothetical protein
MKATTALFLWVAFLIFFLIGLRIQNDGFEKNYLAIESEDIIK